MAQLSILTLGTLKFTVDAAPLAALRATKARTLLAYLAVESDRAHRRESLAGLLWPEVPETARTPFAESGTVGYPSGVEREMRRRCISVGDSRSRTVPARQ